MLQSFINANQLLKKITDKKIHIYNIKKGDKIRLLESLRNGDIFKVQLLTDRQKGSFYYFIESKNLKHFSLIESQAPTNN